MCPLFPLSHAKPSWPVLGTGYFTYLNKIPLGTEAARRYLYYLRVTTKSWQLFCISSRIIRKNPPLQRTMDKQWWRKNRFVYCTYLQVPLNQWASCPFVYKRAGRSHHPSLSPSFPLVFFMAFKLLEYNTSSMRERTLVCFVLCYISSS